jgi:NAD(P)-dependent dehydrogenase (short-subunit alcohol dehydrogenase family)
MKRSTAPKRVIITGGSGGIGRSVVRRFLDGGATVVNLDREPLVLRGRHARQLTSIATDLADATAIERAFEQIDLIFRDQPADLLVAGASIGLTHHILEARPEDIDRVMGINVRGTLVCAQQAARRMVEVRRGRIVVITSLSAAQAWAQEPLYCVSKAAQMSMVQCLATELAPYGILVNAVAPGVIDVRSRGMSGNRARADIRQHYEDRIPLGRYGAPEEVAEAIWYLATVTYTTGQSLYLDGGFLAAGLGYFGSLRKDVLARVDRGLQRAPVVRRKKRSH